MDEYGETPIELLAFNQCDAKAKFADWLRSGGTLLKNPNIGCGINTLTMLGVFSRKYGEEMVRGLASDPQRRGTTFFQIMQYVFHRNGRNHPMNELTGYIDTPSRLNHFFQWLYLKMGVDTCIIVKFNRELQPDVLGHTVLVHKDETGSMTIYDPQAEREIPLTVDSTPLFNSWITQNNFSTASVILYRDTDIDPDKMDAVSPAANNSKTTRRYLRVPLYRRNSRKNPETTSRYKKLKPLSPSEPIKVDQIEPIPFHNLSKKDQNLLDQYFHSPTEAPLIIPDFSERTLDSLAQDNVIFMTLPGNSNVVRRRYLIPSPPVSFPIDDNALANWEQQVCTTNQGCTEHALSILKIIPDDIYAEMIRWQNIMATGSDPNKLVDLLRQKIRSHSYIRAARMAGGTKDNIEYAFKYIPLNHGTPVMITFANLQMMDPNTRPKAIGHTVIFAKNATNTPVIYDGTLRIRYTGMDEIMHYLQNQNLLGHLFIPVYQSMIIHRGTKRSSIAVRRGNSSPIDTRSTKRARIPDSQRKTGIQASAKTKRAYEINRRRFESKK
jgi:hypothetical protein